MPLQALYFTPGYIFLVSAIRIFHRTCSKAVFINPKYVSALRI